MSENNPFPTGAAVAAYLRDSGGEEQELSVIQQESEIRAWCKKRGLNLSRIFSDAAKPGSSTVGRTEFHAMLEHFKNGASEAGVIIWRSNRLGRNVNDTQFYKADLRRRGYIVHSLMDDIPEGPAGQLVEFVLDWKDQVFLDQLSEDVKRGLRHNLEAYGVLPGSPPRGFRRELVHIGKKRDGSERIGARWVPDPDLVPLVQKAFELRAQGLGLMEIQRQIPLYKSKNCWATFFDNELYTGVLHFGDLTIPDYCTPIISRELWQAVQSQRRLDKKRQHPRRQMNSDILLSGLIECQDCGALMNYHYVGEWEYYACSARQRSGTCNARHIPLKAVHAEVLRLLREKILNVENAKQLQARLLAEKPANREADAYLLKKYKLDHAALKREIRNLVTAIKQSKRYSAVLDDELQELEQRETALREKISQIDEQLKAVVLVPESNLERFIQQQLNWLDNPATARATIRKSITSIQARRTDDQIQLHINYIPPHLNARQGRAISSMGGVPVGALSIPLIATIDIPAHKRPSR